MFKLKKNITNEQLQKLGFEIKEGGCIKIIKRFDCDGLEVKALIINGNDRVIKYGYRKEWFTKNVYDWKRFTDVEKVKPYIQDLIDLDYVEAQQ